MESLESDKLLLESMTHLDVNQKYKKIIENYKDYLENYYELRTPTWEEKKVA